jgi:sugar phosphate isomerase/epimerase
VDPVGFLEAHADRLAAVHFKDYRMEGEQMRIVTLGEGVVPLRECAEWLRALRPGTVEWLIAEQDSPDGLAPAEAVRRNAVFLKEVLG